MAQWNQKVTGVLGACGVGSTFACSTENCGTMSTELIGDAQARCACVAFHGPTGTRFCIVGLFLPRCMRCVVHYAGLCGAYFPPLYREFPGALVQKTCVCAFSVCVCVWLFSDCLRPDEFLLPTSACPASSCAGIWSLCVIYVCVSVSLSLSLSVCVCVCVCVCGCVCVRRL